MIRDIDNYCALRNITVRFSGQSQHRVNLGPNSLSRSLAPDFAVCSFLYTSVLHLTLSIIKNLFTPSRKGLFACETWLFLQFVMRDSPMESPKDQFLVPECFQSICFPLVRSSKINFHRYADEAQFYVPLAGCKGSRPFTFLPFSLEAVEVPKLPPVKQTQKNNKKYKTLSLRSANDAKRWHGLRF